MQSNLFTVTINGIAYTVKLHSDMPRLYNVSAGHAYHRIGKTDAGLWVYVENALADQHMPLQQIGHAIEEYMEQEG